MNATRLILSALAPHQTPAAWESDRARSECNWDDLAVRAIVLGLAPQLHRRLAEWQVELPARAAAKLGATYLAQAQRNRDIYDQLGDVLAACSAIGLRPIALKGAHLAAAVYPDPALRPMNDIDLLFEPTELSRAEQVLSTLGYGGKRKPAELGAGVTKHTATFRRSSARAATPNPYLSAEGDRTVEPHVSLEEAWFGLRVDITPGVRERAVDAELSGHACRVLAREDLLLHVAVHFCFHLIMGAPSMVQLTDLLALTQAGGTQWQTFADRAIARRAAPYALAALTLACDLLGAPVPDAVMRRLAGATPERMRARIAQLGLPDVLRRTQQRPLTSIRQRIDRGLRDRAETARWALDWRSRWQVWKTALAVGRTDTGRMLLGHK